MPTAQGHFSKKTCFSTTEGKSPGGRGGGETEEKGTQRCWGGGHNDIQKRAHLG